MTPSPAFELDPHGQPVGLPVPGWTPRPRPEGRPLTGRHVMLERLDPARHLAALHAAAAADGAGLGWTYLPYGPFESLQAHQAWAGSFAAGTDPLVHAIVVPDRGCLGHAALMRIDPAAGAIEIGHVYFSPALQRTPAATEAIALLLGEAFALGYRRVEWKCNALNAASCRAAERLGFAFEGIFRQATVVKGRNRDTAWYAMLDTDWPRCGQALAQWLAADNFDAAGRQRRPLAALRAPSPQPSPAGGRGSTTSPAT